MACRYCLDLVGVGLGWALLEQGSEHWGGAGQAVKRTVQFGSQQHGRERGHISERQSVVYKLYPFQIEMRVKMQLTWPLGWLWPCCYGHRCETAFFL